MTFEQGFSRSESVELTLNIKPQFLLYPVDMNRKKFGIHATPTLKLPMLCLSYQIVFQALRGKNSLVEQQSITRNSGWGWI